MGNYVGKAGDLVSQPSVKPNFNFHSLLSSISRYTLFIRGFLVKSGTLTCPGLLVSLRLAGPTWVSNGQ